MEVYQIKTYLISICKINTTGTHFKADVRGPNETAYTTVGFILHTVRTFWGVGRKVEQSVAPQLNPLNDKLHF